jgi:hypothetical protein
MTNLGWRASIPLQEGIARAYDAYLESSPKLSS